jgi:hypothetical protein
MYESINCMVADCRTRNDVQFLRSRSVGAKSIRFVADQYGLPFNLLLLTLEYYLQVSKLAVECCLCVPHFLEADAKLKLVVGAWDMWDIIRRIHSMSVREGI